MRKSSQFFYNPDPPQTRVEHPRKQFVPVNMLFVFLPLLEAEPEHENIVCHQIYNNSLVVTHTVLQVDDSLVLEI